MLEALLCKDEFLLRLESGESITAALRGVGRGRQWLILTCRQDPEFAEAVNKARPPGTTRFGEVPQKKGRPKLKTPTIKEKPLGLPQWMVCPNKCFGAVGYEGHCPYCQTELISATVNPVTYTPIGW